MLDVARTKRRKRAVAAQPELPLSPVARDEVKKTSGVILPTRGDEAFVLPIVSLDELVRPVAAQLVAKVDTMGAELSAPGTRFEYGACTPDFVEMFISRPSSAGSPAGVLHVRKKDTGWAAQLAKASVPYVLSEDAVASGYMPATGESALPATLASVVPPDLRFWLYEGEQAKRVRDALVAKSVFNADLVKSVNGELRLCMSKMFLVEPEADPPSVLTKAELVDVFTATNAVNPFQEGVPLEKLDASPGNLLLLSCPDVAALTKAIEYVGKLPDSAQWLLEYDGADDTIVTGMAAVGRVFKLDGVTGAEGRAFVSTVEFPPQFVEWVHKSDRVDVSKPFAGYTDFAACLVDQKSKGYSKKAAQAMCGRMQADAEKRAATTKSEIPLRLLKADAAAPAEEQYVLGVVLEPDVVDAQKDTYSQDDVRRAAFTFMENHQNVGLMHKSLVNEKVRIVESYLAPIDFTSGTEVVKKGTWLLGVHVLDDAIWAACKQGALGGFSIGGDAIRTPESAAATPAPAAT